ncbi:TetR/AcrR family transcriptional regulator [Microbacterium sp. NIBRBAC000506063]|uniref:TetR/AcrR family transcriptional regulator n=1 Tax=Microbacterium sp. NIBRBAC000506063 TaxID=2734618 RepID=UPI001CB714CB|nr:TetR/AcrR family transcriptional regulator [Microbacterium sp. NIBRBAC000506063]
MTPATATHSRSTRARGAEGTRRTIVRTARELFVAQGYRATSLRDLATAAGISHPGLLRHFSTKDEVLAAVVGQLEAERTPEVLARIEADEPGTLDYASIARENAAIPGYLALYAALAGEASTVRHPAHAYMRDRYANLREIASAGFHEAIDQGTVSPDRDPMGEAIRLEAAWDGLQLLEQYLPERVSVVDELEAREGQFALPVGWRDPDDSAPTSDPAPLPASPAFDRVGGTSADGGYRVGRERRARIVTDALTLFAAEGYGDTSLREIAEKVGVSKSTLLHHYGTKEELLRAVLGERDRLIGSRMSGVPAGRAAELLRDMPAGAAENHARSPGLIEVYAVLSCEAVPVDHPAHAYFTERFRLVTDHFTALFRAAQADGDLPSHRAPNAKPPGSPRSGMVCSSNGSMIARPSTSPLI